MKKTSTHWRNVVTVMFMSTGLWLTGFVFANSYELAFNRDLPYVHALQTIKLSHITPVIDTTALSNSKLASYEGGFGAPIMLKIPAQKLRIPITPAIYAPNGWLARSNAAHYLIMTPSHNNNLGNTMLYIRKSWRTVSDPTDIKQGDNLFVDTNRDWRYMFRVNEVNTLSSSDQYVIGEGKTSKLVLSIADENTGLTYLISADMVNVQSIQ